MPAGNWSLAPTASGAGGGGGRLLYPSDGAAPLQYSEALAACRRAVSEQLLEAAGQPWAPSEAPINLYMPRFEVEFSASLVDALKMLNISAPFSPGDLTLVRGSAALLLSLLWRPGGGARPLPSPLLKPPFCPAADGRPERRSRTGPGSV